MAPLHTHHTHTLWLFTTTLQLQCISATRTLSPFHLQRLPVGAIRPRGWLEDELTLQARGISGELPHFWSYINGSNWVGGTNHEALKQFVPYYINGLVPLSYQIDDANILSIRDRYTDYILAAQDAAANQSKSPALLGPTQLTGNTSTDAKNYWSLYLAVEAFESLAEAASPKQHKRIIEALLQHHRAFYKHVVTSTPPLSQGRWAFGRYEDAIVGIQWLLDQPSISSNNTALLWDLMERVRNQSHAIMDWEGWYRSGDPFAPWKEDESGKEHLLHHGVDIGQAMKLGALWWRAGADPAELENPGVALAWADRHAHMSDGMFFADENMGPAGKGDIVNTPSRGTETCTVVETMYSMRTAWEATANVSFYDRLERIAFNSLPAALWPDVTANVYHHASNQIATGVGTQYQFSLYFCCSANVHQGWPKFVGSLVQSMDTATVIVVSGFAPSFVSLRGGATVQVESEYPFSDNATVRVNPGSGYSRLALRIPCWVDSASIVLPNGTAVPAVPCALHEEPLAGEGTQTFFVSFQNRIRLFFWPQNSSAPGAVEVHRGAITYALRPLQNVTTIPINGSKVCATHQVEAASPWNYALRLDSLEFERTAAAPLSSPVPFDPDVEAPLRIKAKAKRLPSWTGQGRSPDPPPASPVPDPGTEEEDIVLVPFGATNIRISVFPHYT